MSELSCGWVWGSEGVEVSWVGRGRSLGGGEGDLGFEFIFFLWDV